MKKYTSEEIQDISSNFRSVARRLSRTDYAQCDANLKRFMNVIDAHELIQSFVESHNIIEYDVKKIIEERHWLDPFEISADMREEISLEYQMLKYSVENYNGNFTKLYGSRIYTSTNSTANDEMRKFIEHIIDPLIDYISEYLRSLYEKQMREEEKERPNIANGITANYSTVVVASTIEGTVSNNVAIKEELKNDAIELINTIKELIIEETMGLEKDVLDVLEQIELDIRANSKPKKGFLVALKSICSGSTAIISLVNTLMKLFEF